MRKNYFCVIGFTIVMIINYFLNQLLEQDLKENINNVDFYKILKQSLHPQAVFLIILFFSKENLKAKTFSLFIFGYMIIEFIFRYFNKKEVIEYNYIIGMILGLIFVFLIEIIKERFLINREPLKIENDKAKN